MSTNRFLTFLNNAQQLVTAIAQSAGVSDANKIVATGSDGRLHSSLMPAGIGAQTITATASENLAAGDFVNTWNDAGTVRARKADASNGRSANGFVLSAITSGQTATIQTSGLNTALSSLTPGANYFLSATTAGTATTTAPTTNGHQIQFLGIAANMTTLPFEVDLAIQIGS